MVFSDVMALKTVLFERSEFTVLAMEYEEIILILCEVHQNIGGATPKFQHSA
ncbi:hypothetical protein [Clostridium manihotivorum]|uniref:hypothetical protein n=1 Tax=Clostridium manihotivorum TaxID=2320868 RepID=UPI0013E34822|nr:hypothetical protein [Clostridium manihotivorum]